MTNSKTEYLPAKILFSAAFLLTAFGFPCAAVAGYGDSGHGDDTSGVDRLTAVCAEWPGGTCVTGSCAQCHDTFDPAICPLNDIMLFAPNDNDFCLKCHENTTNVASVPIVNRTYSYRAGGYIADPVDDIRKAFDSTSAHNLGDIKTFITGRWGYTVESNPCTACHNPHLAQGDPEAAPDATKSAGTRGWLVSRPSEHDGALGVWGDGAAEKMNAYTSTYQAPYRYGSTTAYEPDGSTTVNGSNLTDFASFCTDCHNATNTIYSTSLERNLKQIDWDVEKHGKGNADGAITMFSPYGTAMGKVLACTDCHEPHGSPNAFLLRDEINGAVLTNPVTPFDPDVCTLPGTDGNKALGWLCRRCHKDDSAWSGGVVNQWKFIHHYTYGGSEFPYNRTECYRCHWTANGEPMSCNCCHYHGSSTTDYGEQYPCYLYPLLCRTPYDRRLF
jgi:hypothetical protein